MLGCRRVIRVALVAAVLGVGSGGYGATPAPVTPRLTPGEMDELMGAVALYPDALLKQVISASTRPLEVVTAFQWMGRNPDAAEDVIAAQGWDASVQALVHYPSVLQLLADNVAWTQQLGQAYARQPLEMDRSIQRLRAKARAAGSLINTPQQRVYVQNNVIQIVPAEPEVVYVPVYDPGVSYVRRQPPHFEKPRGWGHSGGDQDKPSAPVNPTAEPVGRANFAESPDQGVRVIRTESPRVPSVGGGRIAPPETVVVERAGDQQTGDSGSPGPGPQPAAPAAQPAPAVVAPPAAETVVSTPAPAPVVKTETNGSQTTVTESSSSGQVRVEMRATSSDRR